MFDLSLQVPERVEPLIQALKEHSPRVDTREVLRAFETAERAHAPQTRRSGDPYIIHPVGVAEVLAELGMDTPTICAALLHDVVEDTGVTHDELVEQFGEETAMLVDGVTKLERIKAASKEEQQAESLRKMLIAMASDYRVLLIKLADRLHNMKTIHHLPREKQKRISDETLQIYAPLAHRLGMQNFKWQLEDLAFATLHPKRYDEIRQMVAERQPERDRYVETVVAELEQRLREVKIRAEITGRPKHLYSIYEKMVVRGREFRDIHDLIGVRVIVDSVKDCYAALGQIHAVWRPVPGRFKDYIAMPKFNLYQSLHTTVVGPEGKPIELQIRTRAMHRTAEYGVAAHWKYKQATRNAESETQWLSQMLDMQSDTADSGEFMRNMRLDLYADEVFVFSPQGDVFALPQGSTPVDFAYAVHTEVGHKTVGARVNGRLVSLEYELRNGETVEILTSNDPEAGPSRDWLEFVGSSRARSKIRQHFSRERREDAIEKGREALRKQLAKQGIGWKRLMAGPELRAVAEQMNHHDLDQLYRAIGDGHIGAQAVVANLAARVTDEEETEELVPHGPEAPAQQSEAVIVDETDDVWVTLGRCCTPAPGDEIMGFVTRGRGVTVHRDDCPNAENLRQEPDRIIPVQWNMRAPTMFRVTVQIEALDRKHLLRDVTTLLGDMHINILSAQVATQRDAIAHLRFTFELADIAHLDHILTQIRRIESVYDAYRVVPRGGREGQPQDEVEAPAGPRPGEPAGSAPDPADVNPAPLDP
ncbi:bifunctional (p)ppGpp synthetase/guanosine-3',5'-bis(diphosphate) 3'-pyrophosphohydrolase [Egibacter rhizosphaerae]|uniref:Bifunctional (P)ppGpp synthetase/guanosine-3',5'-bis(Diphosphate) 3'-pyrophosphohydrolase n=1 Tax=Egibacter rhizosphaerae TaxID=1670831 RepID=A0A411YJU4_9ACTN|nr:bifunctional (p)ppGpp synthetase/guanosine-3',5'-bis(diphosphate) 3'-pyrophosphohydrolase [Egibacter rhizosphaerae]QBI21471.1 bifunctional (p)ppGpp synthetase/guanosine-3',5'-bis(diphosphate) 3'-pyrophosphohydrolase [Egibacter rhizosphaerae]